MIKIYYRRGCRSSQRVFCWFEKHNIDVQKQQISQITRAELIKLLQHSDDGLKDVVKNPRKANSEVKEALQYMNQLSLNKAIDFILSHSYIMPTPIIIDDNKHFIGYNENEIRIFLPKEYRQNRL